MNKSSLLVATTLLSSALLGSLAQAQVVAPATPPASSLSETDLRNLGEGVAFPYEKLESALKDNVSKDGLIFYAKIKGNNDLETFVRAVAIADMKKFPAWPVPADPEVKDSKDGLDQTAELAFLINAYNALFIKAIADAYPVNGPSLIKDLDTAKTRVVGGVNYSFADLRRKIAEIDPRALFALPDGTNSGPRASMLAYRYLGLNTLLNEVVKGFINDTTRVAVPDRARNVVQVSPFLATVDEFFRAKTSRRKGEGVRNLLAAYTTSGSIQRYFGAGAYQIEYTLTNNTLNEQFTRGN